ncbi:hypothetical protein AB835_05170 [Candidatus Endobugula sertula]|uniref:Peptidoglycan binding-like domain-containing protein n=1 Tax=Candidatus Endobugula sertula TaxID=62101 RepID=A0A1D2QRF7_9GAMM|nr:hypothetical protein AB835_05170 [Candidatus Endobugula sertula]
MTNEKIFMNSQNIPSELSKLSEKLSVAENTIQELQQQNQELQDKADHMTSERDRVIIENRLAVKDAELARSFKKTDYTPLIQELFAEPTKQLRKQALTMMAIVIIVSVGVTYVLSGYLIFQNNQSMNKELAKLNKTIDLIHLTKPATVEAQSSAPRTARKEIPGSEELTQENSQTIAESERQQGESRTTADHQTPTESVDKTKEKNTKTVETPNPKAIEKSRIIQQQTAHIIDYIKNAERQKNFPSNYKTDRNELAQLYLIIMQQASNSNLYYESYVKAMIALGVSKEVLPNGIESIMALDQEFLQAIYSAYVITRLKQQKKWRYRDIDRRFSSYYSPDSHYQLGAWQIVNGSNNYDLLPKIFAFNIQRVVQQAIFNGYKDNMLIPDTLYYAAYGQDSKNQAVKNLFKNKTLKNHNGILELDISSYPLTLNKPMIYRLQKKLAETGVISPSIINGIAGPKTTAAIIEYRIQNDLTVNEQIDLELLRSLDIRPSYQDLVFN